MLYIYITAYYTLPILIISSLKPSVCAYIKESGGNIVSILGAEIILHQYALL